MKRISLAAVFAFLALVMARSQDQKVTQIAPGVFFWQGDTVIRQPSNCTWVVFNDYVLVIDANFPWGAREILLEIQRTTNKPIRFVFNTHYHADHGFGNGVFMAAGATIVSSRECREESLSKGETDWRNQILNRAQRPNASDHDKAVAEETRTKGYQIEHPTLLFEDRMAFDDGEHRVELRKLGPGHSKGDAVAWLPKERILFTGDLCVNWGFGNNVADADADYDNWLRALDTMVSMNPGTVVVGHGELGATPALSAQKAYLADMLDQVRKGVRAGKTADQVAAETNLTRHKIGGDKDRNAASVKAMYGKVARR